MHKRAFQALQCTFMHVSGIRPTFFDQKKTIYNLIGFFNQNKLEGDLRHA